MLAPTQEGRLGPVQCRAVVEQMPAALPWYAYLRHTHDVLYYLDNGELSHDTTTISGFRACSAARNASRSTGDTTMLSDEPYVILRDCFFDEERESPMASTLRTRRMLFSGMRVANGA
jgi:hypothetical protein